uniref:Solute carrier family 29 member 1 (Augustine blood group) n=1 Tax=Chelonoidis abingdonii TaxID=106734 RepID=A0A8C0J7U6_CHEAB
MTTSSGPSDRYKAVWLIFFTLGLGTLLPWNFFLTATRYFTNRLGDPQNVSSLERLPGLNSTYEDQEPPPTYLQARFNNFMTLCAMLPLLIFTCLNSFLHQRIPQKVRILGSLVAILLVFMMTAALVKVPLEPLPFFVITMVKIILINSFGAILQGSLFGLAGLLPVSYTAPIMSGQGMAGTFAALAMICAISSGSLLADSAFGYFITACVVILLAIGCYILLPRLVRARPSRGGRGGDHPARREEWRGGRIAVLHRSHSIWVMALSVCFIFTVTIGVYPAVTAEVKSTIAGSSDWEKYFIPVSCFLMFNIFDWLGRSLTAVCLWVSTAQLPMQDTGKWVLTS